MSPKWPKYGHLTRRNKAKFSTGQMSSILATKELRADCQTAYKKGSWPSNKSGSNMSFTVTSQALFLFAAMTWCGCLRTNRPCTVKTQWPGGWQHYQRIEFGGSRSRTFVFTAAANSLTSWQTSQLGLKRQDKPAMNS